MGGRDEMGAPEAANKKVIPRMEIVTHLVIFAGVVLCVVVVSGIIFVLALAAAEAMGYLGPR